jgi:hypothetical protein
MVSGRYSGVRYISIGRAPGSLRTIVRPARKLRHLVESLNAR